MARLRLAVLVSGRGSNLQAIVDAIASGALDAEIAGVLSDRPGCAALARVPAALRWSAEPATYADKRAFEAALGDAIEASAPDWIVCAGYMRLLGPGIVRHFAGRMLNIHPSLLPRHRGLDTHARALAAGDAEHGCSVHLVDAAVDAGTVLAQAAIPILPADTPQALATRLLPREHALLTGILALLAAGRLRVAGSRPSLDGHPLLKPLRLDCDGQWVSPST